MLANRDGWDARAQCRQVRFDSVHICLVRLSEIISYIAAASRDRLHNAAAGVWGIPMQYRLRFMDSIEQTVRELRIETDSDDTAINYSSTQSICFNMPVELWRADEL